MIFGCSSVLQFHTCKTYPIFSLLKQSFLEKTSVLSPLAQWHTITNYETRHLRNKRTWALRRSLNGKTRSAFFMTTCVHLGHEQEGEADILHISFSLVLLCIFWSSTTLKYSFNIICLFLLWSLCFFFTVLFSSVYSTFSLWPVFNSFLLSSSCLISWSSVDNAGGSSLMVLTS